MDGETLEHRHLRSALEFALLMAEEGKKLKPPIAYPDGLKKYLKLQRVPGKSLGPLRRVVEDDDDFRRRLGAGAIPELVDPIGRLWLQRPDGWEADVVRLAAEADAQAAEADAAQQLRRSERRREAAERAAGRAQAEIVGLAEQIADRDATLDELRADVTKRDDEIAGLRAELVDTRNELRHARERFDGAVARLEAAEVARDTAVAEQGRAEGVRDEVLADRAVLAAEHSELARLAAAAQSLAEQLAAVAAPPESGQPRPQMRRKALAMPGGVMGDSQTAAEYLLRSGASVLVDGYNVSKLAWPDLDLEGQRVVLLDAVENLARRYGSDITVVFDGAEVIGAAADRRRIIRVVFSTDGVIADDVIRDEVGRLPVSRQVVVVTNDQEIVRDVRSAGANTMSSEQFVGLMR